jgi:transposase
LRGLVRRVRPFGREVRGVVESMNGARFVHDTLEEHGWEVLIADAQKVKGLAPLACKTDKIDARVLAELSWHDLVPAIWLPDPTVRRERELARFRLHLVRHRTALKNRIHATLITFGKPCPVSDLFGHAGRELLDRLAIPEPWRRTVDVSLAVIDELELRIAALTVELRRMGAEHRYIPLLVTAPGIGWVNAFTIARRSATSLGSRRRRSCAATPACARGSSSPAAATSAARSPSTAPSTCAGRCLRPPCTPARTRSTPSATSAPGSASAASVAPGSPRSSCRASSPRRSGTCSPATNPSLRQAPFSSSRTDGSSWKCATGTSLP